MTTGRIAAALSGAVALGVALLLGSCSHVPNADIAYYLPKVTLELTITSTLTCTDANRPLVVSTVVAAPTYSRNDLKRYTLPLSALKGTFSDVDVAVTLTSDGRLAGFNTTQTGQGQAIVQALVTLGTAIAAAEQRDITPADACATVRAIGKDKGVTLVFAGSETFGSDNTARPLAPAPESAPLYALVAPVFGRVCLAKSGTTPLLPLLFASSADQTVLHAVQPARYELTLHRDDAPLGCMHSAGDPFWKGTLDVPQQGVEYSIPLPSAPIFGKQSMSVAFADSGALTSIHYGADTAAAAVANAGASVVSALKAPTTADRVAELKARADLIAQQQRLLRCTATPASCQ